MQDVSVKPVTPVFASRAAKKKRASFFETAHGLRPTPGLVIFDRKDRRLTLLNQGVVGRYVKGVGGRLNVQPTVCNATDFLALILGEGLEGIRVYMYGLLIEADDGFRIRKHVPTAVIATGKGAVILDLHETFEQNFLTYKMVEQAGADLSWRTDIRETRANDDASLMAAAIKVASEFHAPHLVDSLVESTPDAASDAYQSGLKTAMEDPVYSTGREQLAARPHVAAGRQRGSSRPVWRSRRELAPIDE